MIKKLINEILQGQTPLRYIKDFQNKKKLTNNAFALYLGKSQRTMYYYLAGNRPVPNEIIFAINRIKERE